MQSKLLSHEKLHVYDKALNSVACLTRFSGGWDKRHAVVDQLLRASESIILNIAEGARLWSTAHKCHLLEFAIGSALECAACLDIALVKGFLKPELAFTQKRDLCEVDLDLCERNEGMSSQQKAHGLELLRQIARMVGGLAKNKAPIDG